MRKTLTAVVATAALGAIAFQPATAAAAKPCSLKPKGGYSVLVQSNGWTTVLPVQSGDRITGQAHTYFGRWVRGSNQGFSGDAEGVVLGRTFRITIYWDNGSAGVYEGKIDRDRFVTGTTYDRFNPASRATFRMTKRAVC